MKRKEILVLFLISMILPLMVGCAPPFTPELSSAKEITSYRFEATINDVLSSDVEGTIDPDNHTVSLTVPYDTPLTSLVATFALSSGATAKIGITPQVSGITGNDFTHPLTYTVIAEDSSTQDWVITVTIANPVRYVATDGDDANDGSEEHPWLTIQHALDTIPTLGTIRVKDGGYSGSITFPSAKMIILQSVNGYSFTFIKGTDHFDTVICKDSLEGTTLEGFTISHNPGDTGGGISISVGCYLNVDNCTISENSITYGGGIYNSGTLTINGGSTIIHNSATDYGGGIYNNGTLNITEGSTIFGNTTTIDGGGIYNSGTLTINGGSTIFGNSAAYGGGISNEGILTVKEGSTIFGNSAAYGGGGIANSGALTINGGSTISGNTATTYGGGIYNSGTLTINGGSTISGNAVTDYGGGICNTGILTITTSTISNNYAAKNGGGIYLDSHSETPTIGGSSSSDTENFNYFTDNYKTGFAPSANQHIRDVSGDIHVSYPTNYYSP